MGLDISEQMVRAANEQNAHDGYQIVYETRDLRTGSHPKRNSTEPLRSFYSTILTSKTR